MTKTKDSYDDMKDVLKDITHVRLLEIKKAISPNGRYCRQIQKYIADKTGQTLTMNYIRCAMNYNSLQPSVVIQAIIMAKEIEEKTKQEIELARQYVNNKKFVR
jgi:protein-disulfide isomerase-like protein with CxxC motif